MAVPGLCKAVKPALGFDDPAAEGSAPGEMSETGVLRMRFSEPVRMADGGEHSPVWARKKRRSGGSPIVGVIVTLLAVFGVLTAVLGVKERSLAKGGAIMDGWIAQGVATVKGEAPRVADDAADAAGAAAGKAGDAAQAGAAAASEELKRQ